MARYCDRVTYFNEQLVAHPRGEAFETLIEQRDKYAKALAEHQASLLKHARQLYALKKQEIKEQNDRARN